VQKAGEKGYRIIKIYKGNISKKKSNALFKEYMKQYLKIKLETSSWKNDYQMVNDYISAVKNAI